MNNLFDYLDHDVYNIVCQKVNDIRLEKQTRKNYNKVLDVIGRASEYTAVSIADSYTEMKQELTDDGCWEDYGCSIGKFTEGLDEISDDEEDE